MWCAHSHSAGEGDEQGGEWNDIKIEIMAKTGTVAEEIHLHKSEV